MQGYAQVSGQVMKNVKYILRLINENKVEELSNHIVYPIKRENPLPDIANKHDFFTHYNLMFDTAFKSRLNAIPADDMFERNGAVGILSGDLWITLDGKIIAINYMSDAEQREKDNLLAQIKNNLHSSVSKFEENVLVWKSGTLTVRLDRVNNNLRYAAWSKGKKFSEKPDLVLYNGVEEIQGTIGGVTYTFKNDKWTYVIDDVQACEGAENCGQFIRILLGDVEKYTFRCTVSK